MWEAIDYISFHIWSFGRRRYQRSFYYMSKVKNWTPTHLSYECRYNREVWEGEGTQQALGYPIRVGTCSTISTIVTEVEKLWKGAPIWELVWSCMAGTVCHLWKEWNERYYLKGKILPDELKEMVLKDLQISFKDERFKAALCRQSEAICFFLTMKDTSLQMWNCQPLYDILNKNVQSKI